MKKKRVLTIILCALMILNLVGCGKSNDSTPIESEPTSSATSSVSSENSDTNESDVTVQEPESEPSTTSQSEIPTEKEKDDKEKRPTESSVTSSTNPTQEKQTSSSSAVSETSKPTTTSESNKNENDSKPKYATAADSKAIADKIVEYINSYRSVPATKLPGLTKYAEYRSRQLVTNFAHDTKDERAAATALKYGEYVDPQLYGMTGEPYYTANARSAIAKAQYRGTVDEIAKSFATLARDSAGHWAYVGSADYKYIAVGVTYEGGTWYCAIAVSLENTDEY